jgi:hypothetical protein
MTKRDFLSKWISYQGRDALHGAGEFGHDVDSLVVDSERRDELLQDYRDLLEEQPKHSRRPFIIAARERLKVYDEPKEGRNP